MGIHANNRDARLSRIYCDGVTYRATTTGLTRGDNPWDQTKSTQEYDAWDQGWVDKDGDAYDLSCCGYPAAGKPAPEVVNLRY